MTSSFDRAVRLIDDANAADPLTVIVRSEPTPLALAHGQLAFEWVQRLHGDAPDTWLLAARAHHLRRWELPRSSYPEGKAGYHRWKRDQRARHAIEVAALLTEAGFDDHTIGEVQRFVRRDGLAGGDAGSQAVEDGACLAFVETQLASVASKLDHDHMIDVLRKTAQKMSLDALAAIHTIPVSVEAAELMAAALDGATPDQ